jgi:hypothetical protein
MTSDPVPALSFEVMSRMAPPTPSESPNNTSRSNFSLRKKNAVMVISNGVHNINNEACIEYVIDNPLINKSWLMATPVRPHNTKTGMSFLSKRCDGFSHKCIIHRRVVVTTTRTTFKPKGLINSGVTSFTTLKLILNIRFAASTARCALRVILKPLSLIG